MKNHLQPDTLRYSSQFIQDKVALSTCVTSCKLGSQKVEFELSFLKNYGPWGFLNQVSTKIREPQKDSCLLELKVNFFPCGRDWWGLVWGFWVLKIGNSISKLKQLIKSYHYKRGYHSRPETILSEINIHGFYGQSLTVKHTVIPMFNFSYVKHDPFASKGLEFWHLFTFTRILILKISFNTIWGATNFLI